MDPDGSHISSVSGITQSGNRLFFGNLAGDYVSYIDLESIPAVGAVPHTLNSAKSEL
jgi:hypothetical protein